jgi:predicted nucleotidyltransferase
MDTRQAEVMARAKAAVAALARDVDVVVAFVFGSQVDGKPGEQSDIDIAAFAHGVSSWGIDGARSGDEPCAG